MLLSKWLRREAVLLLPSPSMYYSATRNRARTNRTIKGRGLSVKISYWNSLRWHLYSLTDSSGYYRR